MVQGASVFSSTNWGELKRTKNRLRDRNTNTTMMTTSKKKTKHEQTVIIDFQLVSIYSPLSTVLYRNVSFADRIYRVSNSCLWTPYIRIVLFVQLGRRSISVQLRISTVQLQRFRHIPIRLSSTTLSVSPEAPVCMQLTWFAAMSAASRRITPRH